MTRNAPHTRTRLLATVMIGATAWLHAPAIAGDPIIPPPESGPKIVDLNRIGSKWEMRDARNGKLIMQERNAVPQTQAFDSRVQRDIEMRPQPSGYDMVVTFTNPTSEPLPAGALYAGMFTLGPSVTYFDFRYGSQPVPANFSTFVGQHYNYPDSQYAPVWVFMNGEYAIGVSLLYSMMDYRHDARMGLMNPSGSNDGEGGKGWGVAARISNRTTDPANQRLPFECLIPPGERRSYVLAVRVSDNPSEWPRTLLPYRTLFRSQFGGVTYRREGLSLQPVVVAEGSYLEPANPLGFTWIASRRPDIFGWRPWADALKQSARHQIQMLWAPSGLYYERAEENFPFQMTTHWLSTPKLATAVDPVNGLKAAADAGVRLGLWWGRSVELADKWEPDHITYFNPHDPSHRQAAFDEMDLAVQAGVTWVGLDTFSPGRVQVADLYDWLIDMRTRYPGVRFIVEPNACDLLHSIAGSFISGWKDDKHPGTIEGLYRVTAPHTLADFLLPGHETFLAFRYNGYRQYFNINPTPEIIAQDMQRFAQMGYTPAIFEDKNDLPPVTVARTWETSVPHDLRLSPAVHPLRGRSAVALGGAFRPLERDSSTFTGRDAGPGSGSSPPTPNVGAVLRSLAGRPGNAPAEDHQDQPGLALSTVNTIVNSARSTPASQALSRAGTFGALPSANSPKSKGAKSKPSTPIRVVTTKPASPTRTAAASEGGSE